MGNQAATIMMGITIGYILITVFIGIWSKKFTGTTSKFMTGGRDMGAIVIGVLMMSEFIGTGSTMGTAQTAFSKGISVSWNLISMSVAFVLFAYFMAPKFQKTGEYTISGVIAKKYGSGARMATSIIMIYALTVVNISMYVGGAAAIASVLKVPTALAVYIIGAVTILYVAAGGLKGVAYTNLLHAIVKYLGIIIATVVALILAGGIGHMQVAMKPIYFSWSGVGFSTIIAWTIANIGAVFSTQYVIQAIGAVSDEKKAKKASLLAGFLLIPIGLMAAFLGVAAKFLFPTIKSVMAIPQFAHSMNPWLGGIVMAGLIAAVFGTVSAVTLGSAALVMKDIYIPLVKTNERHHLIASRVITIVLGILPIPFALFMPGILTTIFFARALRTTITVVAICMFYLPYFSSSRGALWGLLAATAGTTVWFILGNPYGIDNIYVAAVLPLLVMGIDHLFSMRSKSVVC